MADFEKRGYTITEIVDKDHMNMDRKTFSKHIRTDKAFPKPFFESGNSVMFWGTNIQYWIDKKSGR
ncbi:hypothetical protein [Leuconostoc gasicomitatum]|uniref:hypothetical protein n=1 Tax=Leuconostoc gasicomitatum TaxID=115778 RepID=UPI001CC45344|nr:hypothetical protein [Leuconostoc gasicomitatum]MBZ5946058.1 hypothetical protein [Leuconostoc gasicomitatum]